MRKRGIKIGVCLILICSMACLQMIGIGEADKMNAYQTYLHTGEAPSLWKTFQDAFSIGVATSPWWLNQEDARQTITKHFNSLTCENEMKADFVMDHVASVKQGDMLRAALDFSRADKVLAFAVQNNMKVRAHTLVWHSQVPRWFFTEDFSKVPNAALASREVMIIRMENYIADSIEYLNTNYPGLVYAFDVVNEAIEPADQHEKGYRTNNNLWYETIGDDFIHLAFTFARKYAQPEQSLFYNDYNCYQGNKLYLIRNLIKELKEDGLIDGLGMQSHIAIDSPSLMEFENALSAYASLGIEIQITELDIKATDNSLVGQMKLAVKYKTFFSMLKRLREKASYNITNITIWGLTDDQSWLSNSENTYYPLLFDKNYECKAAFFGAILDSSVPLSATDDAIAKALADLGFEENTALPSSAGDMDGDVLAAFKPIDEHNPVMLQRFGADPYAMVYENSVYLYMTGDVLEYGVDGTLNSNTYGKINTINVLSTTDLVNFTDHGAIRVAGSFGAATWANHSWAPAAAWKEINGEVKFFLYFANSAGGIGVLMSDSPTGPFVDPIGKPLVSHGTPGCANVTWMFDPAVLVDDDGRAYLYFGGGIPEGMADAPKTARVIELGDDMISVKGEAAMIDAPFLFEDSGINKIGNTYYYSYCTNFHVTKAGEEKWGIKNGQIAYMTSESPMGPFTFAGPIFDNPGDFFGVYGNNHHCMFMFKDNWYMAYHTQVLEKKMGLNGGYRSTFINQVAINTDGTINKIQGTMAGVEQMGLINPYTPIEGETMATMAGVSTRLKNEEDAPFGTGNMILTDIKKGSFAALSGVDFGDKGSDSIMICYRSESNVKVQIAIDLLNDSEASLLELPGSNEWIEIILPLDRVIKDVRDVYIIFQSEGLEVDWYRFYETGSVSFGTNPLINADFPDPDVIRVDDTYYMVSTTMYYMPGCVILRSYDLINWEYAARVYDTLEDTKAQRLEAGESAYGKGMWAASLRYHNETYYVCFVANDTGNTYLYRAQNIEGPWSKSYIEGFYHDCSLLFDDDGRTYIIHGGTNIRLTELNNDLTKKKEGGIDRIIVEHPKSAFLGYEGSHMYKINGKYYLFLIHSLTTHWKRAEACFVSDSLDGEFVGGDILNDDMGYFDQGIAQGGIVDTPDGRWFAVLFQDRGALGRIPVLVPMTWKDDMPILGYNGKVPIHIANVSTRPSYTYAPLVGSDDFTRETLLPVWEWNHMPDNALWKAESGKLTFVSGSVAKGLVTAKNTLTQRTMAPACEAIVTLDGSHMKDGDYAGLCMLQSQYGYIAITKKAGQYFIVAVSRNAKDDTNGIERSRVAIKEAIVTLKVIGDFTDMNDLASFYYLQDDVWQPLLENHQLAFTLDHFTGNRFGLFYYATENAGGRVEFSHFQHNIRK